MILCITGWVCFKAEVSILVLTAISIEHIFGNLGKKWALIL